MPLLGGMVAFVAVIGILLLWLIFGGSTGKQRGLVIINLRTTQSVLTLDDSGVMGIRAVENSKVVFYPVTIVKDARDGMYVTGLPLKVDVITVGQEFVKAGDTVKAVQDTGTSDAAAATSQQGAQS